MYYFLLQPQRHFASVSRPKITKVAMLHDKVIDTLRLIRSQNVGPRTFFSLIDLYGTPKNALKHIEQLSLNGGRAKPIVVCTKAKAQRELEEIARIGAKIVTYDDPAYSPLLRNIYDPAPFMTYFGDPTLMSTNCIAVVGARGASLVAKKLTETIASDLSKRGYTIVSGLARGIDTCAHIASIEGGTIAVVAGGLDHVYPPENIRLFERIKESGLILAEMPVGCAPLAQHFPWRNRIIAGLSIGTVVIEAAMNSGSLITANCALQENREVFAVPGFPIDPRARGCNYLIKNGAYLIEDVDDIIANLPKVDGPSIGEKSQNLAPIANPLAYDIDNFTRNNVRELLSSHPCEIESIASHLSIPLPVLQVIILELELAGNALRHPGNKISSI